mmetsp:Transcript_84875/g.273231  ORF Transcript_84875/g.273231 Transcript_84875/m.273231 type:complete len:128 (-) Transcript_84875:647-1030(-)
MPGDVSDLALRFLHALSIGCTPVVIGGPAVTIPLPFAEFVDYRRFARFATVRDVGDGVALLRRLLQEPAVEATDALPPASKLLAEVSGLFTEHVDGCGFPSGKPFMSLLARSLEVRAQILRHLRWHN